MERRHGYFVLGLAAGLAVAAAVASAAVLFPSGPQYHGAVLLTGDIPRDEHLTLAGAFSGGLQVVRTTKGESVAGVPLASLLPAGDFDRLAVYADDYEATIETDDLTELTVLAPYGDSARIASGDLPASAWVKNVTAIVLIDEDSGLSIPVNGRRVSYGSMLDGGIDAMAYGRITAGFGTGGGERRAGSAYLAAGIGLADLLAREDVRNYSSIAVCTPEKNYTFSRDDAASMGLFVTRARGAIRLADPDTAAGEWPAILAIEAA